jgi:hypothetical protein
MSDRGHNDSEGLWRHLLGGAASGDHALAPPADLVQRAMIVAPAAAVVASLGDDARTAARDQAAAVVGYGRYLLSRQLEVLRWLAQLAVPAVALKGFAAALCDWPDPAQRIVGDLDLLVRRKDLGAIVEALTQRGFRFGGGLQSRWGFLSDASFVPFFSVDRQCNVDLHVEPDSYPLHRGLDADAVFAAARTVLCNGVNVAVPSAELALLIGVANLAMDKFAVADARKLVDIARLLQRQDRFDWHQVEARAQHARLTCALRTALSLAAALGLPADRLPAQWRQPPMGLRGWAWRRVVRDGQAFATGPVGTLRLLEREWLLAAHPAVAARLAARRLRGVVLPRSGLPPVAAIGSART